MFTGIVEEVGEVLSCTRSGSNLDIRIKADLSGELRVDQSVSHNGVCLTVVACDDIAYTVTAVQETLDRSNLGDLGPGHTVNLERSLKIGDRLDGHMVQGHVDTRIRCTAIRDLNGSHEFTFQLPEQAHFLVQKGSVCINGVSLTIASLSDHDFSVAVIPYTFAHTNFRSLTVGAFVNIEFDILGKYVARMLGDRVSP